LEDCLKAQAADEPTLIVIEDLHWIDALSHDLLDGLARALAGYAVCFVLAYRPPQMERLQNPRIEALEQFTRVELSELTTAEAESAVRAKLTQLYPARGGALPGGLVKTLMARAQGNPFYLEELLNYLHDRSIDPSEIGRIELPDSLHTLILSRVDQLSESEKTTLRVASIVGRMFRAKWLTGYYPELGSFPQVKAALDALEALDITPLDSPEPELAYLFKHIVTHEVTYESLPFATRARLHEQLARYLENVYPDALPLEVLAFHYGRSENQAKQMEYLRKAGEAAQNSFANDAALDFYAKLLPLLKDDKEIIEIHLKHGQVYELIGEWDEAESNYRAALELSKDDAVLKASTQFALGKLKRLRGDYQSALDWLTQAQGAYTVLEDTEGLAQTLIETGGVLWQKGEYEQARKPLYDGLALAREIDDKVNLARALINLGNVIGDQGDNRTARVLIEESLAIRREMGDKSGVAASLHNLGNLELVQGNYITAREFYEESLALRREMGNKVGITNSLNNLGNAAMIQGDYDAARELHEESLMLRRELGDKYGIPFSLINLGLLALVQGNYSIVRPLFEEALLLCNEIDDKSQTAYTLLGLGLVDLIENKSDARKHILHSLRLRQMMGEQMQQTSNLIGVAKLALQDRNPQFAAQLLGAVDSALKALNVVIEIEMKAFYTQTLAQVKEVLGDEGFQFAWDEGAKWSLEEVVKKVLED
jgi:predicted ATPase